MKIIRNKNQKKFLVDIVRYTAIGFQIPISNIYIDVFLGREINAQVKFTDSALLSIVGIILLVIIYLNTKEQDHV